MNCFAILLSGNVVLNNSLPSLQELLEKPEVTDFSAHIISAFNLFVIFTDKSSVSWLLEEAFKGVVDAEVLGTDSETFSPAKSFTTVEFGFETGLKNVDTLEQLFVNAFYHSCGF